MKRIKTVNGYAIYEATSARDEANYNCRIGHYNLYLSSDIRDFGLSNSYPDWEDVDSMAVAVAYANGSHFAVATEMAWELSDSTIEDTALRDEIERRLEAGQPMDYIRDHYDTENGCFILDWMDTQPEQAQNSAEQALIDLFDLELKDDGSPYGGIAFAGETVRDFVLENGIHTVDELNSALAECHIILVGGEPEYTHVEPLTRDRKADLFDHLLCRIIDEHDCDSGYLIDILRGCDFSDDEVRAALPWLEEDERLAPVGLDRGGATPRDVEYSDGSFGVEQPRWRVYYEGDIFPEDHYVRGSVGITREYWDSSKAHHLYDYCEKHHVPVWLDDTYYCVTEHDGECYC